MPTSAAPASYDPSFFTPLFAVEDQHFWFRARNRVIRTLVQQITAGLTPGYRVLEVGCGTGNVLRVLEHECIDGQVIGLDLFAEGLGYARQRTRCSLVQADVHTPPFSVQFDVIGLFDVLEHLPDDVQVLRDLHALLGSGGSLLLTVPAHASLWSYFDEESHHCRRYELADLERKLATTGYRVAYLTQWMASLFPLIWLGRRMAALADRRPRDDRRRTRDLAALDLRIVPVVNDLLTFVQMLEARLLARRYNLPIGSSLIAVARKVSG
jgi:SAM-dependent methyltransferase